MKPEEMEQDVALPTTEELRLLTTLVQQWDENEAAMVAAEEQIKRLKAAKEKLEIELIPGLMASAGNVAKFELADGRSVTINNELYASIAAARQAEAFAWLEEHGHAAVIKDQLTIVLGRGDEAKKRAEKLIAAAESEGISDMSRKRGVHPGTLQALIKEQLEEGVAVPKETFGVYQVRRAEIKLPKKTKKGCATA